MPPPFNHGYKAPPKRVVSELHEDRFLGRWVEVLICGHTVHWDRDQGSPPLGPGQSRRCFRCPRVSDAGG